MDVLAYIAAAMLIAWGSAHLVPTQFRVCPFVLTGAAALLVAASLG